MKTKPKPRFKILFDFDGSWTVRWHDSRGNSCKRVFGTEEAAQAWAAQEKQRDGQPSVKGQE